MHSHLLPLSPLRVQSAAECSLRRLPFSVAGGGGGGGGELPG